MLNRNPKPRPRRWIPKKKYSKLKAGEKKKVFWHNDWMAVRALRKFVNGFGAADGYNLNDVHEGRLSSAKKAKIRRYVDRYRLEIISINTGKYVLKHYRDRQTLRDAVAVSQQETPLGKDQRNAVFYTPDRANFRVKLRRGKGFKGESRFALSDSLFKMDRIRFDSPDFLDLLQSKVGYEIDSWQDVIADEPELVIETALEILPKRKRYSMLTGKYSTEPVRAKDFLSYFRNKIMEYMDEDTGDLLQEVDFIKGIQALD